MLSTTGKNLAPLLAIIAQSQGKNFLTVPMLTLDENSQYIFKFTFQNYVGVTGSSSYTINTLLPFGGYVNIQNAQLSVFPVYQPNFLIASTKFFVCTGGILVDVEPSMTVLWQDITNQ